MEIFVTGYSAISGLGSNISTQDLINKNNTGNHPFMPLGKATKWLPFDIEMELLGSRIDFGFMADRIVCPVQRSNAELADGLNMKGAHRFERHQLHALTAARAAMSEVDLDDRSRFACISATGGGGLQASFESSITLIHKTGSKRLMPTANLAYLPTIFGGYIANHFGLQGPSDGGSTACAASGHAISSLIRMILLGEADGGLVVGAEATICPLGIESFSAQHALGNGKTFQSDRSGFVMGEGAGALFIESGDSMVRHGRTPLLRILGYGSSSDGNQDLSPTAPCKYGQSRAILAALRRAGCKLSEIDFVKVHGTATPIGDVTELESLHLASHDEGISGLRVFSPKSWVGHTLGASAAIELSMIIDMAKCKNLLPTRNLSHHTLDVACDKVTHVMEMTDFPPNSKVLTNAFGFAGTNSTIIVKTL